MTRIVGLDVGARRIGVAISDASRTLARPVGVVECRALGAAAVESAAGEIARLAAEDDDVDTLVIGHPRRLDGSRTEMTDQVEKFAAQLGSRTGLPVVLQDERLTSREAEARLAVREKNWRIRKQQIDAAAAAIILQDYLDGRSVPPAIESDPTEC